MGDDNDDSNRRSTERRINFVGESVGGGMCVCQEAFSNRIRLCKRGIMESHAQTIQRKTTDNCDCINQCQSKDEREEEMCSDEINVMGQKFMPTETKRKKVFFALVCAFSSEIIHVSWIEKSFLHVYFYPFWQCNAITSPFQHEFQMTASRRRKTVVEIYRCYENSH